MVNNRTVGVIGLGVTGCQTAAFFAAAGHQVLVYDKKPEKLEKIRRGQCPVFEAQLTHHFQLALKSGKIRPVEQLAHVWRDLDTVFLAPGLTDEMTGQISYAALRRLASEIAEKWNTANPHLSLVVRHPLYLGASAELFEKLLAPLTNISLVLNPAMYRQSHSISDTKNSPLHVISSQNIAAAIDLAKLYMNAGIKCDLVSQPVAELLPSVCGSFHALKIAFGNEIASLASSYAIPSDQLLQLLSKDTVLNSSAAYLRPGNVYGGLNLPRSVSHVTQLSQAAQISTPLLNHLASSNEAHFSRLKKLLLNSKANRIGLFGISYRPDTDDTRGSAPIRFVESLLALGKQVRIYDPQIQFDRLEGANWFSLLTQLPLAEKLLTPNLEELLGWSEELVLFHPPSNSQVKMIQAKPLAVLNWSGTPLNDQSEA